MFIGRVDNTQTVGNVKSFCDKNTFNGDIPLLVTVWLMHFLHRSFLASVFHDPYECGNASCSN